MFKAIMELAGLLGLVLGAIRWYVRHEDDYKRARSYICCSGGALLIGVIMYLLVSACQNFVKTVGRQSTGQYESGQIFDSLAYVAAGVPTFLALCLAAISLFHWRRSLVYKELISNENIEAADRLALRHEHGMIALVRNSYHRNSYLRHRG